MVQLASLNAVCTNSTVSPTAFQEQSQEGTPAAGSTAVLAVATWLTKEGGNDNLLQTREDHKSLDCFILFQNVPYRAHTVTSDGTIC